MQSCLQQRALTSSLYAALPHGLQPHMLFLPLATHGPASRPLHLLLSLPGKLFVQANSSELPICKIDSCISREATPLSRMDLPKCMSQPTAETSAGCHLGQAGFLWLVSVICNFGSLSLNLCKKGVRASQGEGVTLSICHHVQVKHGFSSLSDSHISPKILSDYFLKKLLLFYLKSKKTS